MAILTLFGQEHHLKDKENPLEQHKLFEIIAKIEHFAKEVPLINPKERSYILLILKITQALQENMTDSEQLSLDRVQSLCDKIEEDIVLSNDLLRLEV